MDTLNEFIVKVDNQRRWITEIQALMLLNFYLNVYGSNNLCMEIEDELIYMYDKLLKHNDIEVEKERINLLKLNEEKELRRNIEIERQNNKLLKKEKRKQKYREDNQITKIRNILTKEELEELNQKEVEFGRVCIDCKELKPLDLYYQNKKCRNNHNFKCKICYSNYYNLKRKKPL